MQYYQLQESISDASILKLQLLNRNNGANQGSSLGRGILNEDILQVLDLAHTVSLPSERDILHGYYS